MDILKMLSDLRSERGQIEDAIFVLERLARSGGKRRGRPPKWMAQTHSRPASQAEAPKRRVVSAEARKRAEAQRRRWAAVRKPKPRG
jgi:hypothetical protein